MSKPQWCVSSILRGSFLDCIPQGFKVTFQISSPRKELQFIVSKMARHTSPLKKRKFPMSQFFPELLYNPDSQSYCKPHTPLLHTWRGLAVGQMELRNLFNENFTDSYPWNLSSAKLRRYSYPSLLFSVLSLCFTSCTHPPFLLLANCHFPCSMYEGCDDIRIQWTTTTLRLDHKLLVIWSIATSKLLLVHHNHMGPCKE